MADEEQPEDFLEKSGHGQDARATNGERNAGVGRGQRRYRSGMKQKRSTHKAPSHPRGEVSGRPADAAGKAVAVESPAASGHGPMLWIMVGLSGFACLVYQILWMRQLGLLFGNTSQAAALTLAVFFGGLAVGGWFWGRKCRHLLRPMRVYGWLEIGIAACGVAVLVAPALVRQMVPVIYEKHGDGAMLVAFKFLWTLVMVFPPAFLMGGTLPVLGQALIRHKAVFGTTTARIYAVNTIGAASGAFATAFLLIWLLGFRMTCVVAMVVSVMAAVLAWLLSRHDFFLPRVDESAPAEQGVVSSSKRGKPSPTPAEELAVSRFVIRWLAFVSGFNLLALEVLWTRMLAQVHENSVYSFSAVLIVVLVCLSLGAWLASWLARGRSPAPRTLVLLIVLGGTVLCVTPFIFIGLTNNLKMLPTEFSFAAYVFRLFVTGFASIGPACLLLGAVFPFLMKAEERFATEAGTSIGMLSAINTLGAILGSMAAGFLLLEWLGLWLSMQIVAAAYLVVAIALPTGPCSLSRAAKAGAGVMMVLAFTAFNPALLPKAATKGPSGAPAMVVEKWESSDCTVSVIQDERDDLAIQINSNYSLGSTSAFAPQIFQARIPLLAFPATDSVFFLGMGTGITAGEALDRKSYPQISKVVACELSAAVVEASKKYFGGGTGRPDLTNGLFHDPRARVLVEDGRNHLLASRESYAMINADLFLPYRRGTGNLYSREHFQRVRERLKPGGVFVQWLPLYQVSEREFGIIARTMISAFPHVSLWRGNFQAGAEIAALVGHVDASPVPACALDVGQDKRMAVEGATHRDMHNLMLPINEQTVLMFYGGNLGLAADFFAAYPLNTDDRPVIEFGTPRSLHQAAGDGKPQFLAGRFAELVDRLQARTPPENDPLLAARTVSSRKLPLAGSAFHRAWIDSVSGDEESWQKNWQIFLDHWIDPAAAVAEP